MRTTVLLHFSLSLSLFLIEALGIVIFLKGFLLTRVVIPKDSPPCHKSQSCPPRYFRNVVCILVDALRYDFVYYNSSVGSKRPFYINQMKNLGELLVNKPSQAKLFRFIADPPTTTMQRLKALTTGTLPTFLDIGSNFNSYQIQEDNLIRQCKNNGLRVTFLGDDTWMSMYPNLFDKSYPFPSLNVKDLDTVDEGVYRNIIPELKNKDSDLIIGHFLGVDHCGHTYGPNNHIMRDKLIYIDNVLRSIFELIDNDTIVFVFGDHGMTSTGDHGGQTLQETEAALLVYSKRSLFDGKQVSDQSVYQTDLVPTVSLLLGLPIPFSSLGMIIPQLFSPANHIAYSSMQSRLQLISALRTNSQQLNAFVEAQIQFSNDLPRPEVAELQKKYKKLEIMYDFAVNTTTSDVTELEGLYVNYMRKVRDICSSVWITFNINKMTTGVMILLIHLLVLLFFVFFISKISCTLFFSTMTLLDAFSIIIVLFQCIGLFSNSFVVFEGTMVTFLMQLFIVILLVTKFQESLTESHRHLRWNELLTKLFKTALPFLKIMICVYLTRYSHSCRDQQDDCTMLGFFDKSDAPFSSKNYKTIILYIAKFFSSYLIYVFTVLHGINVVKSNFKLKHTILAKCAQWIIAYSFIIALCDIFYSEILSVWMYWIYLIGAGFIILIALKVQDRDNTNIALASYCWIVMVIWNSISFVVKGMNIMLLIPFSLSIIQFTLIVKVMNTMPKTSLFARAVLCSLLSYQFFFGFGHQATIPSLRFDAAFVGVYGEMTTFKLPIAGLFVTVNTLASQILSAFALPLLLPCDTWHRDGNTILSTLLQVQLLCTLLGTLKLLCSVVAALMLRRHLMVWAVFGPRFMYESAFQSVSIFTTLLSYVFVSCNVLTRTKKIKNKDP